MGLVATIKLTALMSYCIDRISVKIGATLCRDTEPDCHEWWGGENGER